MKPKDTPSVSDLREELLEKVQETERNLALFGTPTVPDDARVNLKLRFDPITPEASLEVLLVNDVGEQLVVSVSPGASAEVPLEGSPWTVVYVGPAGELAKHKGG